MGKLRDSEIKTSEEKLQVFGMLSFAGRKKEEKSVMIHGPEALERVIIWKCFRRLELLIPQDFIVYSPATS